MAYGTPEGVAPHCKIWTRNGVFTPYDLYGDCTNPTHEEVTQWIAEVSSFADVAFANNGFVTPIVAEVPLDMLTSYVQLMVSDLVHNANSSGRFHTDKMIERAVVPLLAIMKDTEIFVAGRVPAWDALGVPRIPGFSGNNTAIIEVV